MLVGRALAAPAGSDGAERLNFLIMGDWGRRGEPHQAAVARQMAVTAREKGSKFIIAVGDNFYDRGVESTADAQWQESFEQVYAAPALQVPWYAVLGNHDYHGNCQAQIDYHGVNPRWNMPARYYVHTESIGGVTADFFCLDTNPMSQLDHDEVKFQKELDAQKPLDQVAWLERALQGSKAGWKIGIGHHPIYSGGRHGDTPQLIRHVLPLFQEHGVQTYFNGHDHDLQHLQAGHLNLICCGAGSTVRTTTSTGRTQYAKSTPGFASVTLGAARMEVDLVDDHGNVLHSASIPRTQA